MSADTTTAFPARRAPLLRVARSIAGVVGMAMLLPGLQAAPAKTPADLIIAGNYLVTMDPARPIIRDGAIAIKDGVIVAIGPEQQIAATYEARDMLPGSGRILLPGLINGHTHAAMTLFRGIADDLDLMEWLQDYIFPVENRLVDREFVRIGTELACWEMIRSGTTTFVDMYFFPAVISQVVEECGLRAVVAAAIIEQPTPHSRNWQESLDGATAYVKAWRGRSSRITPAFGPHAAYTIGPEHLRQVRSIANELDVPVSIHISETRAEVEDILSRYGQTPIRHLHDLGFFQGRTFGAHVVWPGADEIPILAAAGVAVIHNPTSNLKLASGIAPVPEMLQQGVAVALGTDGAASNNDLDMWEEMRLAALIHKVYSGDPKIMPAATALRLATLGGAQALGLDAQIGALTVGRRADVIQVAMTRAAHLMPMYDVISHLVYAVDAQDVVSSVVDGRVLMRNGVVIALDTARIEQQVRILAGKIRDALDDSL